MTLGVAVETRNAIDRGLLSFHPEHGDALGGMRLRLAAIEALKAAQRRLEQVLRQEELLTLPDFFVLLIESRTWGYFHPTPTGFDPNCRPTPPNVLADDPAQRDAVIIASETAMRPLLEGRLPFDKALKQGVVAIDADEARRGPLIGTWAKAYPRVGFSRFVCA